MARYPAALVPAAGEKGRSAPITRAQGRGDNPAMSPSEADTGPLAQVDCQRDADGWTLVFVREVPRPLERVWNVLTDPAQLRA